MICSSQSIGVHWCRASNQNPSISAFSLLMLACPIFVEKEKSGEEPKAAFKTVLSPRYTFRAEDREGMPNCLSSACTRPSQLAGPLRMVLAPLFLLKLCGAFAVAAGSSDGARAGATVVESTWYDLEMKKAYYRWVKSCAAFASVLSALLSPHSTSTPTPSRSRRMFLACHIDHADGETTHLQEMDAAYEILSNAKLWAEHERRNGLLGSGGKHSGGQQAMDARWALHRLLRSKSGIGGVQVQVGLGRVRGYLCTSFDLFASQTDLFTTVPIRTRSLVPQSRASPTQV